ncbi:cysteine synthase A [compost metagenome]
MRSQKQTGSIVSVICDSGDRYASTYYNADWLKEANIDIRPYEKYLNLFLDGKSSDVSLISLCKNICGSSVVAHC